MGSASVSLPAVDVSVLSQAAQVDALVELRRARAWADAAESRLLAALAEPGAVPTRFRVSAVVEAKQYVREQIACALQVAPVTVNDKLHTARTLVSTFPATLEALESGAISMRHARILVDGVQPLDAQAQAEVEARVLGPAAGQTPTRFKQTVARAVLAADPRGAEQRHEDAHAERRVQSRPESDAMGSLHAVVSAQDLQAVREAIQAAADAHPEHHEHCVPITDVPISDAADPEAYDAGVKTDPASRRAVPRRLLGCSDPGCEACAGPGCAGCISRARTADQRRADAFVSLLLGSDIPIIATRHGRRPRVQVSVALSTLLGLDDQPGDLDGYGPIPADLARRMAGDPTGTWRRMVTDDLGHLIDYGRCTYRPPQDLTDHVIARDRVCRFPGCGHQARTCELDHLLDWDLGGHTSQHNMLAGCPRHHHLRHDAGWTVVGSPEGTLTWITPTGHSYDDPLGVHPVDATSARARSERAAAADLDPPPF